jgi:hypothetical protein
MGIHKSVIFYKNPLKYIKISGFFIYFAIHKKFTIYSHKDIEIFINADGAPAMEQSAASPKI